MKLNYSSAGGRIDTIIRASGFIGRVGLVVGDPYIIVSFRNSDKITIQLLSDHVSLVSNTDLSNGCASIENGRCWRRAECVCSS